MISKICSGHSFYGSIRYICQTSKKGEILVSEGVRDYDTKLMIQDFQLQHAFRPEKKQACFHGILSFYPGENPTDKQIAEIAQKYLSGLGITGTQFAVVKHTDKAHVHVHLVANLVDNNGMSISDKWIGLRGKKLAQQLTLAYKLKQGTGKDLTRTAFKNLRTPDQFKYRIYAAVKQEVKKSNSLEELEKRLSRLGIQMEYKYKCKTSEKQGVTFRLGKYSFKGSQIDRQFSYAHLAGQFNERIPGQKPRLAAKTQLVPPVWSKNAKYFTPVERAVVGTLEASQKLLDILFEQQRAQEMRVPFELRAKPKLKPKRPRL